MNILALDLSTFTGWAAGREGEAPRHGVWELRDGAVNHGRYFSALAQSLEDAIRVFQPDLVVMEAPLPHQAKKVQGNSANVLRVLLGLCAVTEMVCYEHKVKCEEASVIDVRQAVLGRQPLAGKAKETVIAFCNTMGWRPQNDNSADALMLWEYRHCLARRSALIARAR